MRIPTLTAVRLFGCCLLVAASTLGLSQAAAPAKPPVGSAVAPSQVYGNLLSLIEKEFVAAAEAMPEDKYTFAPTAGEFKGVRTFADQVKHVSEANGYFFHDPTKPPVDNRKEIDALTAKADILKALKDSFVVAHAYVDGITPENAFIQTANGTRAGQASLGIAHMLDHYGQMAEYLRMNGIVPPASRAN